MSFSSSPPRSVRKGQTRLRRSSARSRETWQVPEINVAPFQPHKFRKRSSTTWRTDRSRIQVFASPGRSRGERCMTADRGLTSACVAEDEARGRSTAAVRPAGCEREGVKLVGRSVSSPEGACGKGNWAGQGVIMESSVSLWVFGLWVVPCWPPVVLLQRRWRVSLEAHQADALSHGAVTKGCAGPSRD